jgi:N-acetylglucosaminyldiphosphoundecaprenol N-acetyl-beta-D-mannosaminyltransferase
MESATVLGCRVDALGPAAAVARIVALAQGAAPSLVVTFGTEMAVYAQRDPAFRRIVNDSALSLCDTVGVLWAARMQGVQLGERVAGVELIDPLCDALARERIPVYLLGARGDTAQRAAAALQARHPGLVVAGARDGYFSEEESGAVAAGIARSGARLLFAGLGSPRQERWLADHLAATGCGAGIGVGGSFDVIAGNVERAPEAWRGAGLEWMYRLVKEPQRWRRQLALPAFVALALRERLFGMRKAAL